MLAALGSEEASPLGFCPGVPLLPGLPDPSDEPLGLSRTLSALPFWKFQSQC